MWSQAGSVSIFPGPFQTRSTDQSWRLDRRLMGIKSPLAARIAGVCYTLPLVGTISYATRQTPSGILSRVHRSEPPSGRMESITKPPKVVHMSCLSFLSPFYEDSSFPSSFFFRPPRRVPLHTPHILPTLLLLFFFFCIVLTFLFSLFFSALFSPFFFSFFFQHMFPRPSLFPFFPFFFFFFWEGRFRAPPVR